MEGMGFGMNKMGGKLCFLACLQLGLSASHVNAAMYLAAFVFFEIITDIAVTGPFLSRTKAAVGVWGWVHTSPKTQPVFVMCVATKV